MFLNIFIHIFGANICRGKIYCQVCSNPRKGQSCVWLLMSSYKTIRSLNSRDYRLVEDRPPSVRDWAAGCSMQPSPSYQHPGQLGRWGRTPGLEGPGSLCYPHRCTQLWLTNIGHKLTDFLTTNNQVLDPFHPGLVSPFCTTSCRPRSTGWLAMYYPTLCLAKGCSRHTSAILSKCS